MPASSVVTTEDMMDKETPDTFIGTPADWLSKPPEDKLHLSQINGIIQTLQRPDS